MNLQRIDRFALETHEGPYERWPPTSRLRVDGALVDARVPGYVIDAQYATPFGTLLVTSYDCPFEESCEFLLLDASLRVVARRHLLAPYASWLLDTHWPDGDGSLVLHYYTGVFMRLQPMAPRALWPRRPWLRLRRVAGWRRDPRMRAAYLALRERVREIGRTLENDRRQEAGQNRAPR